jgi:catechol 2,3-dioxygenase-like lactoylglutathione lyase family enzyme
MITALDNISIRVSDLSTSTGVAQVLLGRTPFGDESTTTFHLDNVTLDLLKSEDGTNHVDGIAFEIADAESAFRICERRALGPCGPTDFIETYGPGGGHRKGRHIDLGTDATFGIPIALIEYNSGEAPSPSSITTATGAVTSLDHVVVRTTHPNRAAALYGARLGLDMRLDRTEPKWGARLMFFRAGDLIIEVVHNLADEPSDRPDQLWGLSWRVAGIEAAHARLKANAFDLSEIRPGRKPGTRVFTVKNNTLGVPTLMIEAARPKASSS